MIAREHNNLCSMHNHESNYTKSINHCKKSISIITELHGNATYAKCLDCNKRYELKSLKVEFLNSEIPPTCNECGGLFDLCEESECPSPQCEYFDRPWDFNFCRPVTSYCYSSA